MTNRRSFLQLGTGCLAHLLLQAACAPLGRRRAWTAARGPVVAEAPFARLEAIGPGAWAVISTPLGGDRTTFANGGLIAGRTGVVAIEGFYTAAGARWLAGLARQLTGRHPTHVVVTHYHIDHASGVAGYAEAAGDAPRLLTTAPTQDAVLRGGPVAPPRESALLRPWADVLTVAPRRALTIDLGDRTLQVRSTHGHTASDLIVEDQDAGLCFGGDLLWNGMFPNFVDADPPAWRSAMDTLPSTAGSRVVPGHGPIMDMTARARFVTLLDTLEDAARRAHADGRSIDQLVAEWRVPESLGDWMASPAAVRRAFSAWYRALGSSTA
ncbi:MAG: MBL fold metallo-hydrolase [Gemmatimonadaceae bacterium]|nr:MBL fold metallo-hydrolase [Gemmatimonadaceae bacterium]